MSFKAFLERRRGIYIYSPQQDSVNQNKSKENHSREKETGPVTTNLLSNFITNCPELI